MAVLDRIRRRTGLLLIIVFGALFLFVIQGLFSNGGFDFLNEDPNTIGTINGKSVDKKEFLQQTQINEAMYSQGQSNPYQKQQYEAQAWRDMEFKYAYTPQFEELGITVTSGDDCLDCEEVQMVQGKNPDPSIVQMFTDPETGSFDRAKLKKFLNDIYNNPQLEKENPQILQQRGMWNLRIEQLKKQKVQARYMDLLSKSNYVTKAEAKKMILDKYTKVDVSYLYVPYTSVVDSLAGVTELNDADLKSYLSVHANEYTFEPTRIIDYLAIPIQPNGEDSTAAQVAVRSYVKGLFESKDDSTYINTTIASIAEFKSAKVGDLPRILLTDSTLKVGKIFGPMLDASGYRAYKVTNIDPRDTMYKATASHILIKTDTSMDASTLEAKRIQAEVILAEVSAEGVDFATVAKTKSEGPSAQNGGSLGEFETGAMIKPFQKAVFSATEEGVVGELVKTQFGYHIIRVDKIKEKAGKMITYIEMGEDIIPSDETVYALQEKANAIFSKLGGTLSGLKSFTDAEDEYYLSEGNQVKPSDKRIGSVNEVNSIIYWAYTDNKEGQLYPKVLRTSQNLIIAGLKSVVNKGEPNIEAVRGQLEQKFRNSKKANFLAEKLKEGSSLEEKLSAINKNLQIANVNIKTATLTLDNGVIQGVGQAPTMVGSAFGLAEGETSKVIKEDNGVVIVQVNKINKTAGELSAEEIETVQKQLKTQLGNDFTKVDNVIKASAGIEDKRFK